MDLTAMPGKKIQLGDEFKEINPESKKQIEEGLRAQLSILTGQAVSQGLFGDDAPGLHQAGTGQEAGQCGGCLQEGLALTRSLS